MMFVKQMDEYVTTEVFDCLIQTSIKVGNLIKVYIGISIVSMMKVFIYWLVSDIGSFFNESGYTQWGSLLFFLHKAHQ